MFLVEREGNIRLMSFKSNPWLPAIANTSKSGADQMYISKSGTDQIYRHSIFLFSGVLAGPEKGMA